MTLEEYRTVFLVASLALMMIAAFPTLSMVTPFPSSQERFSELWILGPNHVAEDYPFNVQANETYRVFVGVGNHLDRLAYYVVYMKFRNQTQPLPNSTISKPSPLPPLYEFQFFLADGEAWEASLNFAFHNMSLKNGSIFVDNISINGVTFPINLTSAWDSKNKGFYYQLFFELWTHDLANSSFQFHNRFVGIWLNMTV